MVSWCLTSVSSTNMAISEINSSENKVTWRACHVTCYIRTYSAASSRHLTLIYRVAQKLAQYFCTNRRYQILIDFRKCFNVRIRRKFAIILLLKILSHLKCVATLPCEMSLSGANCRSVSLIAPLVSGVTGLNASSSSNVDTLNV